MQNQISAGMAEATNLTRSGRLTEATALIQRLLGSGTPGPSAPRPQPEITPPAPRRSGLRATLRRLAERSRALDIGETADAPPLPEGARFDGATHASALGQRDYRLYVPAFRPAQPMPLVVMLHGCTQNPVDFAVGTGMNALAEEFGVMVAYPAQPAAANANRCWNWFRPEDQTRDRGEPGLIAGIVREIVAREGADPSRVYVAGLSAGGAAAAVLAAVYPDVFAAAGVHSGLPQGAAHDLPSALMAMRQGAPATSAPPGVPMIVFHGDADRVVHPRNGAALAEAAGAATNARRIEHGRAGGRDFTRVLLEDGAGRVRSEHWTVHGAGHAWSGGDAAGSHTDPAGPQASREMLRFFLERRR